MTHLSSKARYALLTGSLVVIAVVAVVVFYVRQPAEPVYNGRPLSAWLDALGKDTNAVIALRQMGPAALPFLVAQLRPRVSNVERSVWSWAYTRGIKTDLKIDRRWKVIDAFAVLGSAGSPAIPDLIPLLADTNTQNAASFSLKGIGAETLFPLAVALTNGSTELRIGVARTLGEQARGSKSGPDAGLVVPALIHGLRDEDWRVRAVSAESLGRYRQAPDVAVPALVSSLQDTNAVVRASAAIGLRLFGVGAKAAGPALRAAAARETNEDARREADTAAIQVDPQGGVSR